MVNELVLSERDLLSRSNQLHDKLHHDNQKPSESVDHCEHLQSEEHSPSSSQSQWTLYDDEKIDLYRSNWTQLLQLQDSLQTSWPVRDIPHPEEEQVDLDVRRSFVYYPQDPPETLTEELNYVICQVLRAHANELSYYQGYHDIAQVILLVFGKDKSPIVLERLSLWYLRDYMMPDISTTVDLLVLVPQLIKAVDSEFGNYVLASGVDLVELPEQQCFFSISSLMTLFAHHIQDFRTICELFSFIFESPASMPIYIYVALVLDQKDRLLEFADDKPVLHALLSTVAEDYEGDFTEIMVAAKSLALKYPLESLDQWPNVSECSFVKTAKDLDAELAHKHITGLLQKSLESKLRQEAELEMKRKQTRLEFEKFGSTFGGSSAKAGSGGGGPKGNALTSSTIYASAVVGLMAAVVYSYYSWASTPA